MKVDVKQISMYDPQIIVILTWLEESTGLEFTITSQLRKGDPGVHGTIPLRGVDLRMRDISIGKAIEKHINDSFQYDPKRPHKNCALLHGAKNVNLHLHIQVHPNTKDLRF